MTRYLVLFAIPLMLLVFTGCGDKAKEGEGEGAKKEEKAPPKEGGATVEEAFEGMKKAMEPDGKLSSIIPFTAPKERAVFPFLFFFSTAFEVPKAEKKKAGAADAYKALAKKHGLPSGETKEDKIDMSVLEDTAKMIEYTTKLFEKVDLVAFLDDIQAFQKEYGVGTFDEVPKGLKDTKTEGDTATALLDFGEGKEDQPVKFVKVDGRWYLAPSEMMK
ncbi:MAG: hypothetical protein ACYTFG_03545 [Planctomycetota bacterium]|jgi:hypothetical protein